MEFEKRRQGSAKKGRDAMWWVKALMAVAGGLLLLRILTGTPSSTKTSVLVENGLAGGLRVDITHGSSDGLAAGQGGAPGGVSDMTKAAADAEDFDVESVAGMESKGAEKFTVIVLGWKRFESLERLLKSLDAADYMGDRVKLLVQIDGGSGKDWKESIRVAKQFPWPHGSKEVRVLAKNGGLMNAWLTCWTPQSDDEHSVILEDDLTVSPMFYRYLKSMWNAYGDREEIAAVTLQRERLVATNAHYKTIQQEAPFGYKLLGTWGFSPSPKHWRKFLKLDFKKMNPHVPGLITSKWFARQRRGKMWSQFFIWYCQRHDLYNIYLTAPNRKTFGTNWREAGVHYGKAKGADFQVVESSDWNPAWDNPPAEIDLYSWGLKKEARSTPTGLVKGTSADVAPADEVTADEDTAEEDSAKEGAQEPVEGGDSQTEAQTEAQTEGEDEPANQIAPEENAVEPANAQDPRDGSVATDSGEGGSDDLGVDLAALTATDATDANAQATEVPQIVLAARRTMKDDIMFMQMLNEGFVEMTAAWICNVKDMPRVLDRTMFVCTDRPAFEKLSAFAESSGLDLVIHLEEHKAPAEMRYGQLTYYFFILFRANLLKSLVDHGVSVFLIESDATWFGDPVSYLLEHVEADDDVVVMHNDYKSPTNLNGGFLWLRSTTGTKEILRRLYKGFKARLDGLAKTGKDVVGRAGNEQQFFKALLYSKKYNPDGLVAKTRMLPSEQFAPGLAFKKEYKLKSINDPMVVLNNWISGNDKKKVRAVEFGYWLLSEDGKTCRALYQKVPTAADFAIEARWSMAALVEKARSIQWEDGQATVFVTVVNAVTVTKALNWACQANQAALSHTLFICVDKASCDAMQSFVSATGVTIHTYRQKAAPVQALPVLKLSVVYALLRSGLEVVLFEASDVLAEPASFLESSGAQVDVAAVPASSGSESIVDRPLAHFRLTDKTVRVLGTYLVAAQRYRYHKIAQLPYERKFTAKLKVADLTAPADLPVKYSKESPTCSA